MITLNASKSLRHESPTGQSYVTPITGMHEGEGRGRNLGYQTEQHWRLSCTEPPCWPRPAMLGSLAGQSCPDAPCGIPPDTWLYNCPGCCALEMAGDGGASCADSACTLQVGTESLKGQMVLSVGYSPCLLVHDWVVGCTNRTTG